MGWSSERSCVRSLGPGGIVRRLITIIAAVAFLGGAAAVVGAYFALRGSPSDLDAEPDAAPAESAPSARGGRAAQKRLGEFANLDFLADASAVQFSRQSEGLAGALTKIARGAGVGAAKRKARKRGGNEEDSGQETLFR